MRLTMPDGTGLFVDVQGSTLRKQNDEYMAVPSLVLVHGGPGSGHIAMRGFFDPLADAAQLIYFDQRGMGRSDKASSTSWNLGAWSDDLVNLIRKLGLEAPVILGQSFGAYVAVLAAAELKDELGGLVLSSAQARPDPADSIARFRALSEEAGDAAEAFFADPDLQRFERFRDLCFPLYNPTHQSPSLGGLNSPEILIHFWSGEYRTLDLNPYLPKVTVPTLVVAGASDPMIPAQRSAELADGLTDCEAELVIIDRAGHGPYRDAPEEYRGHIRRFLRSRSNATPIRE